MTCTKIAVPGGIAIVCTRGARRKKCATCKAPEASLLCDGCDRPLCPSCSVGPTSSQDFCPACALPAWREWLHLPDTVFIADRIPRRMAFRAWVRANATRFAELVPMTRAGAAAAEGSP